VRISTAATSVEPLRQGQWPTDDNCISTTGVDRACKVASLPERSWIEINPEQFDRDDVSIAVTINPVYLPPTQSKIRGEIEITSNGGTQTIQVSVER
jgi:hypothetical protein